MQILELPDASEEQCNKIIRMIEAMNITVQKSKPKKVENPFNYNLERMKDRVENQEFVEVPDWALESDESFDKWMQAI